MNGAAASDDGVASRGLFVGPDAGRLPAGSPDVARPATHGWPPRWRRGMPRLRRFAGRRAAALRRHLAAAHRMLRARWLRSLQLRVVTTTLVISAVVVTVLGFILMQQITSYQLGAKEAQADNLVDGGLITAETQPGVKSPPTSANSENLMVSIVQELAANGAQGDYGVAIVMAAGYSGPPVYRDGETAGIVETQIPARLVSAVTSLQRKDEVMPEFTPASMNDPSGSAGRVPGLVYGVPVGSYYQLYYFFPLTQVQSSLSQIQGALVGGAVLVLLFSAIAALVTRWVVAPVRRAARSARRLSTGNLGERMPVRGADELAALAASFNEMAASLQEKMNALEELSQVQRQFVSDVSHELRTPLTTIKIAGDVLFASREQLDGPAARSAELLSSQLERFELLLTDLLEISRYDANVAVLEPEPADICDLARQAADEAQQLAERRGAKIEFRLPAEPCVADVDRRRVERILRNLLVNAVEHGEGKDAVVTVAGDSAAVAVSVRDFGIGLAPGQERLVFDRFWRADPARARTTGGTGLGLSIAMEDARIHGGWLEAWGAVGQGSVFRLTLPRTAGGELDGSPLPLGPDDPDLADTVDAAGFVAPVTAGLAWAILAPGAGVDGLGGAGGDDPGGAAGAGGAGGAVAGANGAGGAATAPSRAAGAAGGAGDQ
jgi:two-component system, OmpR family, sensor histidine kinase MtrB